MRREELRSSPSDTAGHGIMDTFLELVLQGVDPQHCEAFVETLSREALLKQYEQGKSVCGTASALPTAKISVGSRLL